MSPQINPKENPLLAAWREQMRHATRNPLLLNLLLKHWQRILERLAYFYAQLASLPRPRRRALQRALATSLVGAAMLLALSSAPVVYANAITVDLGAAGKNPSDGCSLVEAIINANDDAATYAECDSGSGSDTIYLPSSTTLNYTTFFGGYHDGDTALPDVTSVIIIEGNGTTIQRDSGVATPDFRLFYVDSKGELTLKNATISGGGVVDAGGGIFNNGGSLALDNSTVKENRAIVGGGIASSGVLTLDNNSVVSGNGALAGGGVGNYGTFNMNDSTLSGNYALGGGGIANYYAAPLTVDQSTISRNYALAFGGGIFSGGIGTISNSTISGNTAQASDGGGIVNRDGTMYLNGSIVTANYAFDAGGGIKNDLSYDGTSALLVVRDSLISDNNAYFGGGVATAYEYATTKIYHSSIRNQPTGGGAAVAYYADLKVAGSVIDGNYSYEYGGGVTCYGAYLEVIDSQISNNTSNENTGGIDSQFCQADIRNTTISGNTSIGDATDGGGVEVDDSGFFIITNSTISNNHSDIGYGGIGANTNVGADYESTLLLVNSTVTGNSTTSGSGGGIYADTDSSVALLRSIVSGNSAGGAGSEIADPPPPGMRHAEGDQTRRRDWRTGSERKRATGTAPSRRNTQLKQELEALEGLAQAQGKDLPLLKMVKQSSRTRVSAERRTAAGNKFRESRRQESIKAPLLVLGGDYNLLGHSGLTNAQAFSGFSPGATDITATSDGTMPTTLAGILNTTLANNGGPNTPSGAVLTHMLVTNSPALDKAPNAECGASVGLPDLGAGGLDQRGVIRPQGPLCDIGAIEGETPTAVNVTGLQANLNAQGDVVLKWQTTTESQVAGFNVARKLAKSKWRMANAKLIPAKHPGDIAGATYRFKDRDLKVSKTYRYKLQVVYLDGHKEWTHAVKVKKP